VVLLLDEPDNFLDIPAKRGLKARISSSKKTVLLISHDRELLSGATNTIVTLESNGAWVHGDSYRTYAEGRRQRQERLGDRLEQWHREERRRGTERPRPRTHHEARQTSDGVAGTPTPARAVTVVVT
jgi:ATPase subunit of ABC transporter with duplicated ATPase domains